MIKRKAYLGSPLENIWDAVPYGVYFSVCAKEKHRVVEICGDIRRLHTLEQIKFIEALKTGTHFADTT